MNAAKLKMSNPTEQLLYAAAALEDGAQQIRRIASAGHTGAFSETVEKIQDALSAIRSSSGSAVGSVESALSRLDMLHHTIVAETEGQAT